MTQKIQEPFPAEYHIKTPCYLTADGRWSPNKEDAGEFDSRELPYRFWDGCTLELVRDKEAPQQYSSDKPTPGYTGRAVEEDKP